MTCHAARPDCPPVPQPRRANTRTPHLCRGRGGRGCRCHIAARPRLSRPVLSGNGHALTWRALRDDPHPRGLPPQQAPQHPQGPPLPV